MNGVLFCTEIQNLGHGEHNCKVRTFSLLEYIRKRLLN